MKKTEKSIFVKNLAEELKEAESIILVNYAGLSVSMQQELKEKLAEVDADMTVVKNTLFKLAGEEAKLPEETLEDTVLSGQNAIILAQEDPIAPLQVLANFAKDHKTPQLRVGIIEGSFQDESALDKLSKLPGKEALLAQVLGQIAAPTYGLVSVLQANLQNLVLVLDEAKRKKA